jgi:hypothetical protein
MASLTDVVNYFKEVHALLREMRDLQVQMRDYLANGYAPGRGLHGEMRDLQHRILEVELENRKLLQEIARQQ